MRTEGAGNSHARDSGGKLTGSVINCDNHTDKSLMRQQLQVMHGHAQPEPGGEVYRRVNPGIEVSPLELLTLLLVPITGLAMSNTSYAAPHSRDGSAGCRAQAGQVNIHVVLIGTAACAIHLACHVLGAT